VEFTDGSTIAQASRRKWNPIALGLAWHDRVYGRRRAGGLTKAPDVGTCGRSNTRRSRQCRWPARAGMAGASVPAAYKRGEEELRRRVPGRRHCVHRIVQTVAQVISDHGRRGPAVLTGQPVSKRYWPRSWGAGQSREID